MKLLLLIPPPATTSASFSTLSRLIYEAILFLHIHTYIHTYIYCKQIANKVNASLVINKRNPCLKYMANIICLEFVFYNIELSKLSKFGWLFLRRWWRLLLRVQISTCTNVFVDMHVQSIYIFMCVCMYVPLIQCNIVAQSSHWEQNSFRNSFQMSLSSKVTWANGKNCSDL